MHSDALPHQNTPYGAQGCHLILVCTRRQLCTAWGSRCVQLDAYGISLCFA